MVATRKSNAQVHPGQIILDSQQTRRTRKQIEGDEALASAAKKNKAERRRNLLAHLAKLDDELEKDEATLCEHSTRPDLMTEDIMDDLYSDNGQQSENDVSSSENVSEGDKEDLRTATPSSSSDLDDGDHAGVESRSDDDREVTNTGKRNATVTKSANTERGFLRAQVDEIRGINKDLPSGKKRQAPQLELEDHGVVPKRIKHYNTTGGLRPGWKAQGKHARSARTQAKDPYSGKGNEDQCLPGAFDCDEPEDVLARVGNSKSMSRATTKILPTASEMEGGASSNLSRRRTYQMGIQLERSTPPMTNTLRQPSMTPSSSTTISAARSSWTGDIVREHKQDAGARVRLDDLPFGQGGARRWRQVYIPHLIAWAGSQEDPFAVNHSVREEMINIWERVFPASQLRESNIDNLGKVVVNALNNWRSDLGKQGHNAVRELFYSDVISFGTTKEREEYVLDALDQKRYLFKYPEMEPENQGLFCSTLIATVYATHIKRISGISHVYGPQIGGLAVACAAVERGLTLFQTGEDGLESKSRGLGFTDDPWGRVAAHLVSVTRQLNERNWDAIIKESTPYISRRGLTNSNADVNPNESINPFAFIKVV